MTKTILIRLSSVFVATAIPNIGVGAAVGVEVWRASVKSGAIACLAVVQSLAQSYRDGSLTREEVDKAFEER
jgi:ABC-type proline/glycine betaine transport system permease subunit